MKLSIVIPAYNASKYIVRCVESITTQDFNDYEIVIVDDGSTDSTYDTALSISNNSLNIRVLRKNNGGVSCARNFGIKNARGKYLMFMDADDYLLPNSLKTAFSEIENNPDADFFVYGFNRISRNGKHSHSKVSPNKYLKDSVLKYISTTDVLSLGVPWAKIYKLSFIQKFNLQFETKRKLFEDICFNLNILKNCSCFVTSKVSLYCYDVNNQSATAKFNGEKFIEDAKFYFKTVEDTVKKMRTDHTQDVFYDKIIKSTKKTLCYNTLYEIYNAYRIRQDNSKYKKLLRMISFMNEIDINWASRFSSGFPRIFATLYKLHPRCSDIVLRAIFLFRG